MNLKDFVAVSGLPGIFRMAANRSNGLIVADLDTGKRRFASSRKHQFTPLESIAIFTDDDDSIELAKVFRNMEDQVGDNPVPSNTAKPAELREYFLDVMPNHDRDRVHISDIKKVVKWYKFLQERDLLNLPEEEEKSGDEEE
ncbi:MAG: hypothetical protein ACI9XO_001965 [Paraglaciecola sp.]|jgi:hypothetical protein